MIPSPSPFADALAAIGTPGPHGAVLGRVEEDGTLRAAFAYHVGDHVEIGAEWTWHKDQKPLGWAGVLIRF